MHRLLVAFGNADSGRLGLGPGLLTSQLMPRVVASIAKYDLQQVAAGGAHTAVVTSGGLVLSAGLNDHGQLGHSRDSVRVHAPAPVLLPEAVIQVACGSTHTLALTEAGRVWAWGSNKQGARGMDQEWHAAGSAWGGPQPVESLAGVRVVSIAAGHTHSLAVCAEGCVYSWGSGPGIGTASASSRSTHNSMECVSWLPQRLHAASLEGLRMTRVFAGMGTSGAVDLAGRAYAWGANAACQLGLPATAPHVETPTRVGGLRPRITKLAFGAVHGMALRQDERAYHWGTDMAGSLGLGPYAAAAARRQAQYAVQTAHDAAAAAAGGADWTRGGDDALVMPEPGLFKYWLDDVAVGLAHSVGVTPDGRLYAWGWGGTAAAAPQQPAGHLSQGTAAAAAAPLLPARPGQAHEQPQVANNRTSNDNYSSDGDSSSEGASASGSGSFSHSGSVWRMRSGAGQLGVGGGADLASPCLVTKLELKQGLVLRQDGGDPFNYQDDNLGWLYRTVAAGHNHTVGLIQVGAAFQAEIMAAAAAARLPITQRRLQH